METTRKKQKRRLENDTWGHRKFGPTVPVTRSLVCGGTMRVGVAMCDSSDGYSKPCWTGATASRRDPLA
jgi:hypothetical protein